MTMSFSGLRHLSFWVLTLFSIVFSCHGEEIQVTDPLKLQQQIYQAKAYDTLLLGPEVFKGQFIIDKPLTIVGQLGAEIDALGSGSALTIISSNVVVKALKIINWGSDQYELDAAILINDGLSHVLIENNELFGPSFGVRADNGDALSIINNVITGSSQGHILDRGDGIHLKRVDHVIIQSNRIQHVRDGIYLESGKHSVVSDNHFTDQQYGLHYMYTAHDEAFKNHAEDVDGGFALMNSKHIKLHHNSVESAQKFGVLLNMTNHSEISANQVNNIINANAKMAGDEGRGMFIYGARDNAVFDNNFSNSEIGIYMAMGGEGNKIYRNQFVNNQAQVKYVGDTLVEWSHDQQGNYWSGFLGWDVSGNGISEQPYQPSDQLDRLYWLYPEAQFLLKSPVAQLLRWTQQQFKVIPDSGVIDSFPMMSPVTVSGSGFSSGFSSGL
ncbi:nitrous oxide reductase family maturation protein NosD [Shewanella donghaensis]|uniref:nitrous oxide reductase family maturation protein NosD n=1 Tax=Shewanella donghaensis TaxID=238836 RepID=UPI001D055672|nr:nitrous oxide reductase family maturation protein NosD [Shewanella donghaensis]